MTKEYQIDISLKETAWKEVFSESYRIALRQNFVEQNNPKEHGFKNHVEGFLTQLKRNCIPAVKKTYNKRQVYVISYWINTGSEINWDRPGIIYKDTNNTLWDDVIVIPLTSALMEKQSDKFDVFVPKDAKNNLFQNSFARWRQIRSVSVKRLGKLIGTIENEHVIKAINNCIKTMLATEV